MPGSTTPRIWIITLKDSTCIYRMNSIFDSHITDHTIFSSSHKDYVGSILFFLNLDQTCSSQMYGVHYPQAMLHYHGEEASLVVQSHHAVPPSKRLSFRIHVVTRNRCNHSSSKNLSQLESIGISPPVCSVIPAQVRYVQHIVTAITIHHVPSHTYPSTSMDELP